MLPTGEEFQVDQADWRKINLTSSTTKGVIVELSPADAPIPDTPQADYRKFNPDFLLFRKVPRNLLYGFQFANIPSINSLASIYMNLERPWVFGGLRSIQKRLGVDQFPLIDQVYYPDHTQMQGTPPIPFPLVAKVGAAHAGFGKMKVPDRRIYEDFTSIMALYPDYVTLEPFIEVEYDFRIQKIGLHYRGIKRKAIQWKANAGAATVEAMTLNDTYKRWADECSQLFGGMDILALDVVHAKDGREFILELNDSTIGFPQEFAREDMQAVRDLVTIRMGEIKINHKP
jgi:hypothetical protein